MGGAFCPHPNLSWGIRKGLQLRWGLLLNRDYQLTGGVMLRGPWRARRYDRTNPTAADIPNQAINHASVAVTSAAVIAVTYVGAIPQLGFIHEHSSEAFALDVVIDRIKVLFDDVVMPHPSPESLEEWEDEPRSDE